MKVKEDDIPGLPELLFSLASEDRLALLSELDSKKQRLTTLSKTINASVQECSRHLERLSDSGLVARDSGGLFSTTSLGKSVLMQFPGTKFLLDNRNYFLGHAPTLLPGQFVERLGELSSGAYTDHISQTLELIKEIISEAKEYVWLIADQPPIVSKVAGSSFASREIPVKLICEVVDRKILADVKSNLTNSEMLMLKDVHVAMAMNERHAGICFPDLNGRPDFNAGFNSREERFTKWCRDLFQHYWTSRAK